jgi:putative ABC transport system substrate-binding protein
MRIIFVGVSDPIGPGFVKSLERPDGNITGFTNFEETMGGKWLELLREIAPSVKRASMLFNPETANAGASGGLYLKSIQTAARVTGTELIVSAVHNPPDIDEVFAAMAQGSNGGVLVMPNTFTVVQRERIVAQAQRYRIPTIYPLASFVTAGGLLSYGVDNADLFRRAPLLGVKRTLIGDVAMSAFDPKRTWLNPEKTALTPHLSDQSRGRFRSRPAQLSPVA